MSQSMRQAASICLLLLFDSPGLPVDKAAALQTIDTSGDFWSMLSTKGHLVVLVAIAPQTRTMTMNGSHNYNVAHRS